MTYQESVNPVSLTAELIRCPSVTPTEAGALELLQIQLEDAGFACERIDRNGVSNLYAKWNGGGDGPVFGFNGHTDVVPPGDVSAWSFDPFSGDIADGWILGRGAVDMKSGVAAFVCAAIDFVRTRPKAGSIAITVTGDEEGQATDGTVAILDWMRTQGETMDVCLVGEPTSQNELGDEVKIGRRGSLTAYFTAYGKQGHSAYPHKAKNPVPVIAWLVDRLSHTPLDQGTENFAPSTLVVTGIDTNNQASNVIPLTCRAMANIRYNDLHDTTRLIDWLRQQKETAETTSGMRIDMEQQLSGDCFLTPPGPLSDLVVSAIEAKCQQQPMLSTSGGTSDARFIKDLCPVVEFGLCNTTMHEIDERVRVQDIERLRDIYYEILDRYFS